MARRAIRTMVAALALAGMSVGCGRNGGPELEVTHLGSPERGEPGTRDPDRALRGEPGAGFLRGHQHRIGHGVKVSDITIKLWVDDTSGNRGRAARLDGRLS